MMMHNFLYLNIYLINFSAAISNFILVVIQLQTIYYLTIVTLNLSKIEHLICLL